MAGKRFVRWLACLALVASACASASAQQVVAPGAAAQRAGADERPRVFVTEHSAHIGEGRILLDEAHQFAITDYAAALARGQRIGRDWYARVRARLAYFTGLSEAYLDEVSLDIHPARYMRELLRQRGLSVGRFDSRYAGRDFDLGVETPDADPSGYGFVAACAAAALHYLSSDLRVDMGARRYVVSNRSGVKPLWNWSMPRFGLSPGAATRSLANAEDFKHRAKAGMRIVNLPTAGVDYHAPFGGVGDSSYGPREQGRAASAFYTTTTTTYSGP